MVSSDKWTRVAQIDEGMKWLDGKVKEFGADKYVIDQSEWEAFTGVGLNITPEMIESYVDKLFEENAAAIKE